MCLDQKPDAAHRFTQSLAERRQAVIHARWHYGVDAPFHKPVTFKLAQCLRQHLVADAAHALLQPGEAQFSLPVERSITSNVHLSAMRSRISRTRATFLGCVSHVGPEAAAFKVLPIQVRPWMLPIAITTLKGRTLGSAASVFGACARELAWQVVRSG
jgi:hypothetical protein